MEVFSPDRDILLPVTLPLPEVSGYCVYVDKDLLVLHSHQYLVTFKSGPNEQLRQLSRKQVLAVFKWQNSQPVVDRTRGVFYFVTNGKCVQVEMETGRVVGRI